MIICSVSIKKMASTLEIIIWGTSDGGKIILSAFDISCCVFKMEEAIETFKSVYCSFSFSSGTLISVLGNILYIFSVFLVIFMI